MRSCLRHRPRCSHPCLRAHAFRLPACVFASILRRARTPQAFLDSLRAQLGADIFAAQYRQRPVSPEGVMIKREWLRRYEELPRRALAEVVAVFTHPYGADFSANLGNH